MNDEEIIKKRLLVDGDGAGDDRRINVLLKQFHQWCNSSEDGLQEIKLSRDHLLSQVNKCEYAFMKSRLTASMATSELENYENISKQIEDTVSRVKEEIIGTKEEFKEAKIIRKNRLEYEVLSKVINEQPDRKGTNEKLVNLRSDLLLSEITDEQLEQKLDMRRKQFHVLFASLQQLQAFLDDDSPKETNVIDVSLDPLEDTDDVKIVESKVEMDVV